MDEGAKIVGQNYPIGECWSEPRSDSYMSSEMGNKVTRFRAPPTAQGNRPLASLVRDPWRHARRHPSHRVALLHLIIRRGEVLGCPRRAHDLSQHFETSAMGRREAHRVRAAGLRRAPRLGR